MYVLLARHRSCALGSAGRGIAALYMTWHSTAFCRAKCISSTCMHYTICIRMQALDRVQPYPLWELCTCCWPCQHAQPQRLPQHAGEQHA